MRRILDLRRRLPSLATDIYVAYLAFRDPRTPWPAKLATILFAFYIINPLDVMPDILPLIGVVDDSVGVVLAIGVLSVLAPKPVIEAAYRHAEESGAPQRVLKILLGIAIFLVVVWLAVMVLAAYGIYQTVT